MWREGGPLSVQDRRSSSLESSEQFTLLVELGNGRVFCDFRDNFVAQ